MDLWLYILTNMTSFNDGVNSLYADTLFWSGATSTTYPIDPDFTRNANFALDRVTSLIQKSDALWEWEDINNTDLPIATTALVSGQADYALSVTHLKILKVRIKDANGNWVTLKSRNRRQLKDSELSSTGTPSTYDLLGNSIILSDIPNYASAGGLEIQFQRGADYFVVGSTTKTPGFAIQFHRLISLYAALDWTETNEMEKRSKKIEKYILRMEAELVEFYSDRHRDEAPSMSLRQEDFGADDGQANNPKGW